MAFVARYAGVCFTCGKPFGVGEPIGGWSRRHKGRASHADCVEGKPRDGDHSDVPLDEEPVVDVQPVPVDAPLGDVLDAPAHAPMAPSAAPVAHVGADAALQGLADALASRIPASMDHAAVTKLVDERLIGMADLLVPSDATLRKLISECVQPTVIEIRQVNKPTVTLENTHFMVPRVVSLLAAGIHVYSWGPAGTGKTRGMLDAAMALGRECEIDTLDPSTSRSQVQGWQTPNMATGEVTPVHTAFTRCWCNGRVYIADEVDNSPGHVQTLQNSALANGHAPLAWGSVERGEGFAWCGTGNTPGRKTPEFPDRQAMSAAFKDRLYFVYWPLDPRIEAKACGLPAPTLPRRAVGTCTPAEWGRWVIKVRAFCQVNAPTIMVTPRATLVGLQALAAGETPLEVAHGLVLRGADQALSDKILSACPVPA